jgi:hypothetical protein
MNNWISCSQTGVNFCDVEICLLTSWLKTLSLELTINATGGHHTHVALACRGSAIAIVWDSSMSAFHTTYLYYKFK